MNGIETLDKIKEFNQDIPVVMLSSQDKIDVASAACITKLLIMSWRNFFLETSKKHYCLFPF
jgi:CheY-like chemotaxis protein